MKNFLLLFIAAFLAVPSFAQCLKKLQLHGMYLQWGYNRDRFSKSDLHFRRDGVYDFTVHDATAKDRPDFSGFIDTPLDITIPQNSYRIGFYLNAKHTIALEVNYDHAKYVMESNKVRRVTGTIGDERIDKDTLVSPRFLSFEHTNGANFYHFNFVSQHEILRNKNRTLATLLWKAGAGFVMPKSDVTIMGHRLDNRYHLAGYIISAEAGARFYPLRRFFVEATAKAGFANYTNVLTVEGGHANHKFTYCMVAGFIGYEFPLNQKRYGFKKPKDADILSKP